jgi:predicted cobalt transporter CbtA
VALDRGCRDARVHGAPAPRSWRGGASLEPRRSFAASSDRTVQRRCWPGFRPDTECARSFWTLRSGRPFTASDGVLWGAAGFAAFSLAPAFGLPPELPGMAGSELIQRQIWWVATVCCTAGGIASLLCLTGLWRIAGIILILLPHLIGAPHTDGHGAIPGEMAATFATASLGASAVFWVVLGWVSGWAQQRLIQTG